MSTCQASAAGGRTKVTRRSGGTLTEISGRAGGLGPNSTPANTAAAAPAASTARGVRPGKSA